MTHHISRIAAVAIATGSFAVLLPAVPAGAQPSTAATAVASFSTHGADGCVATETSVFMRKANDGAARLEFRLLKVNECTNAGLLDVQIKASVAQSAVRFTSDLSLASINLSTVATDRFSHRRLPVAVRLTWRATEEAVTNSSFEEPVAAGKFIRSAAAVTRTVRIAGAAGTVSAGSTTVALTEADSAWIGTARR